MKKLNKIALVLMFIFTFVTCTEAKGMLGLSNEAQAKTKKKVAASKKKAPASKKTASKKASPSKSSLKKATPKKASSKKSVAKKSAASKKKATVSKNAAKAKKTVAKGKSTKKPKVTTAKKSTSKKAAAKKVTAKKRPTTKKSAKKTTKVSKKRGKSRSSRGTYSTQARVMEYAKSYLGVPYVFGSASGASFDCSGFTMYIYKKVGISLPHSASGQSRCGTKVSRSELVPGDLVFFHTYSDGISHVGIYIGGGSFIHASSGAGEVTITSLSESYYAARYMGATRILQ